MDKKYLVILSGSPRGGEKTWDSLFKYVIDYLGADLAICTTEDYVEENTLFTRAKFKWILNDLDDFNEYYSEYFEGSWRQYLEKGKGYGLYESGKIKRYKRSQFTAALKGEPTNWRVPIYRTFIFSKLMIKYPDEFIDSFNNKLNKKGLINLLLSDLTMGLTYFYLLIRRRLGS